jgi:choline dehydrogenase
MSALIAGLNMAREIGHAAALRPFTGKEVAPGLVEEKGLQQFFRDGLVTFWHQSGTAKMGRDAMLMVDSRLKIYGVEGLRIADASVMPRVSAGNTMAPCVVIGEQTAAFIAAETGS